MKRPRTFYGWQDGDKFKVSLWAKAEAQGANTYDTKEQAIAECIVKRTDGNGKPVIVWE